MKNPKPPKPPKPPKNQPVPPEVQAALDSMTLRMGGRLIEVRSRPLFITRFDMAEVVGAPTPSGKATDSFRSDFVKEPMRMNLPKHGTR